MLGADWNQPITNKGSTWHDSQSTCLHKSLFELLMVVAGFETLATVYSVTQIPGKESPDLQPVYSHSWGNHHCNSTDTSHSGWTHPDRHSPSKSTRRALTSRRTFYTARSTSSMTVFIYMYLSLELDLMGFPMLTTSHQNFLHSRVFCTNVSIIFLHTSLKTFTAA